MSETRNAVIEGTMLGREDHGILTCYLFLNYGGSSQGFGGYCFDSYTGKRGKGKRVGSAYGTEFISRILKTLEVDSWEKLKGVHLRAEADHSKVQAIGHILKDQWFYPERDMADFIKKEKAATRVNG